MSLANNEFKNFKEMVRRYLEFNNHAKVYLEESKKIKAEMDRMVEDKKKRCQMLKEKAADQRKQMGVIEPYIMKFMQKNDILNLETPNGNIKYKESNPKKRVTNQVIRERLEKIFQNHENKEGIISQIFTTEEREKKTQLKCL